VFRSQIIFFVASFFISAAPAWSSERKISNMDFNIPMTKDILLAKNIAKAFSKPVAALFVGTDWCQSSEKLMNKIILTTEFQEIVGKKILFLLIDFKERVPFIDKENFEQRIYFKEALNIQIFPTLVLLDQNLHEITRLGFSEEVPAEYGKKVVTYLDKYQRIHQAMHRVHQMGFDELSFIYKELKELGSDFYIKKVIDRGIKIDKNFYFHFEKYKIATSEEKKEIKEIILSHEIDKKELFKLKMDLIDFSLLSILDQQSVLDKFKQITSMFLLDPLFKDLFGVHAQEWVSSEIL
jgi:hypothetical protein